MEEEVNYSQGALQGRSAQDEFRHAAECLQALKVGMLLNAGIVSMMRRAEECHIWMSISFWHIILLL